MSTFVLVHGSWHGAWCWDRLIPLIRGNGHTVHAFDLPSMGQDTTALQDASFARCVRKITERIDQLDGPVILVGHSMAGVLITQVAESCPERLGALVYLSAFVPRNGESCFGLSSADNGTVAYGLQMSTDGLSATLRDPWIRASFYNDCTDQDVEYAVSLIRPQPMEPFVQSVTITEERSGAVPGVYIECLRDHAITPGFQRRMQAARSFEYVLSLDTGHSPFISAPALLAEHLESVAVSAACWARAGRTYA
jgi:pimeloyl-ACP methyl ester carboxylesterase